MIVRLSRLVTRSILILPILGLAAPASSRAATYYVGTGATCGDQPNDRPSLAAALLSAALTTANDEIRLTRTLAYTNVSLDLVDWHPGVAGAVTIAGGYDNCDDAAPSGRIELVGQNGSSLVTVTTSGQPTSTVTLRALDLRDAEFRGLVVTQGGAVTLQNVWIHGNAGGVLVGTGGGLSADAATEITDNELSFDGGGISCSGSGSYVGFSGKLLRNISTSGGGGSLYVGPGCHAELFAGALLEGHGEFPGGEDNALFGGGVAVEDGVLIANGGANQVRIRGHQTWGLGLGGGVYASGANAVVSLTNTVIEDNNARLAGAGIYAANGATVVMDRAAACPFIFSCSVIRSGRLLGGQDGEAMSVDDAVIRLRRTVVAENGLQSASALFPGNLIFAGGAGEIELDGVLLWKNHAVHLLVAEGAGSTITGQYITAATNSYEIDDVVSDSFFGLADVGELGIYSSILQDTKGFETLSGGTTVQDCLLVDTLNGMNPGGYFVGFAQFISPGTGDFRQLPQSWGVDFCDELFVPWPGSLDVERQARGVDIAGNPDGAPGIGGGKFDAGFDEVLSASNLIFADGFESGNVSSWSAAVP